MLWPTVLLEAPSHLENKKYKSSQLKVHQWIIVDYKYHLIVKSVWKTTLVNINYCSI